ncbi:MAG: hypothetical protein JWL77_1579 [Chthonomonadaceae bacterium]|nr:hypothetical protein [Chthonomonadaceae bacterium]
MVEEDVPLKGRLSEDLNRGMDDFSECRADPRLIPIAASDTYALKSGSIGDEFGGCELSELQGTVDERVITVGFETVRVCRGGRKHNRRS